MKERKDKYEKGYSITELMIVLIIAGILIAFGLKGWKTSEGDERRFSTSIAQALEERRTAAIRLLQTNSQGMSQLKPVEINFNDLSTTAPLLIEGEDKNRDFIDDNSGELLTFWKTGDQSWRYSYQGKPLNYPGSWKVVNNASDLGTIPQIPNTQLTASITFDETGRPPATKQTVLVKDKAEEARFWAIYFRDMKTDNIAFAVAVHGSGLIEIWTYDFSNNVWQGTGGRHE